MLFLIILTSLTLHVCIYLINNVDNIINNVDNIINNVVNIIHCSRLTSGSHLFTQNFLGIYLFAHKLN